VTYSVSSVSLWFKTFLPAHALHPPQSSAANVLSRITRATAARSQRALHQSRWHPRASPNAIALGEGLPSQGNRLSPPLLGQPGKHVPSAVKEEYQHGGRREDDGGARSKGSRRFHAKRYMGSTPWPSVENLADVPLSTVAAT
jgi:hypothetical protein